MKYIIYVLLMIADILLFIFYIMFENYLIQVLLLHVVIIYLSWRIYLKFNSKIDELPYYIILFMPILGIIIYYSLYFSLHYFVRDATIMSDYEQLLFENSDRDNRKRINYEREIKTMSFLDLFAYIDPEKKKEILIDSQYSFKINNAKILKKGLESSDKEVQHYSATLLNSQENEFTNNISYLREQYNETKNKKVLDELITSFSIYLNSTLIGEDSIDIFRKEYIDVLLEKINTNTYDLDTLNDLFKAYIKVDDYYNATLINNKIEDEFGLNYNSILNKLNILYKKGYYSQMHDTMIEIDKNKIETNHKLKELHEFFIKED